MSTNDVKRLAEVLAIQAEIEGMKSENMTRESNGFAMAYGDEAFCEMAEELRVVAAKHDDQF